jgi:beta-phosphoglucomutase-like phosphatase (HAD superfamily)
MRDLAVTLAGSGGTARRPAHCVVVEDAPLGISAARAGGTRVLGVARQSDEALLWAEGAELVTSSLDEIAVGELTHGGLSHRVV